MAGIEYSNGINMNGVASPRNGGHPVEEGDVIVVLGAQWGDEGKGKVVDMLAANSDVVCRCQGGSNAGHTVVANGIEYYFQLLPCGVSPKCTSVLGNGVVIHMPSLFSELSKHTLNGLNNYEYRLVISDRAHLVFDFHQDVDGLQEQEKSKKGQKLGTTRRGIGPTYSSKASRSGIRVSDLVGDFQRFREKFYSLVAFHQRVYPELNIDVELELAKYRNYAEKIRPYVKETVQYLNRCMKEGKKIVVEGANATMLDIDFGTYPFVTSSNCSVGGVCTGLGIPPTKIKEVVGVFKGYTTRHGDGPFPTELLNEVGDLLRRNGHEVGPTTKRQRRCGWLDLFSLNYTHMLNGYTALCLIKLDVLDILPEIKIGVSYSLNGEKIESYPSDINDLWSVKVEYITMPGWLECTEKVRSFKDLPENAKRFVEKIEEIIQVPEVDARNMLFTSFGLFDNMLSV